MTTKPRRPGSKGIRLYYHYKMHIGNQTSQGWDRTRESHNYSTGLDAVRDLVKDPTVKIVATGTESGAMCLHYQRVWA